MLAGRGLLDVGRGRRAIVREPDWHRAVGLFCRSMCRAIPRDCSTCSNCACRSKCSRHRSRRGALTAPASRRSRRRLPGMREAARCERERASTAEGPKLRFHDHDLGFHGAIALASGNRLISHLFEAMATPLRRGFHLSRRGHLLRGRTASTRRSRRTSRSSMRSATATPRRRSSRCAPISRKPSVTSARRSTRRRARAGCCALRSDRERPTAAVSLRFLRAAASSSSHSSSASALAASAAASWREASAKAFGSRA